MITTHTKWFVNGEQVNKLFASDFAEKVRRSGIRAITTMTQTGEHIKATEYVKAEDQTLQLQAESYYNLPQNIKTLFETPGAELDLKLQELRQTHEKKLIIIFPAPISNQSSDTIELTVQICEKVL